jgi:signal transduction histidine kinase
MSRRTRPRLVATGLRSRVTITFALVTLAATLLVSAASFTLSKRYLIDQRERASIRQTFLNARLVRDLLQSGEQEPQAVLDSIVGEVGTLAHLRVDGEWFTSGVGADPGELPSSLLTALDEGAAAHQRVDRPGQPRLLIGIPLLDATTDYVEAVPLDYVERTLRTLMLSLLIGSAGTTMAGALIGVYVSRRLLRPLNRMSVVAEGITAGELSARLDAGGDRDLESLVDSFNEMVSALQERIEREQRFTSDVSHELRTPLTVLKAAVQLVEQRSPDLPPRALAAVAMMAKQVDYFERLVLDLLEISRFDSGTETVELEDTDVRSWTSQVSQRLGGPPVEAASGEIRAAVDRRRVDRILSNIIENANRYAGGVEHITVSDGHGRLRFVVDDRGTGIPEDERDRVFERFWRGRDARHQETKGSGLGLALVAEHVRLLSGRVAIDNAPSGGTRFIVEIPLSETS